MTTSGTHPPRGRADGAVFISYHQRSGSVDAEFVEAYLRAGGIVPWRDVRDLESGRVDRSVEAAFAEGLSGAVLLVSDRIEDSAFVPENELPLILAAHDANPSLFQFHIVNTIRREDGLDEMDTDAPVRKLQPKCAQAAELSHHMQRALLRAAGANESENELGLMLRDLLRRRLEHWQRSAPDVLEIAVQTRSDSSHHPASPHTPRFGDLHIRLQQDQQTQLPEELDLHCLKEAIPHLIDTIHAFKIPHVLFQGGCHPSLAWALGASLPKSRPEIETFTWRDNKGLDWNSTDAPEEVATKVELRLFQPGRDNPEIVEPNGLREALRLPKGHPDVVVLLADAQPQMGPLHYLADRLRAPALVIAFTPPGSHSGEQLIPHGEGAVLAHQAGRLLRRLADGARLHVAVSVPVALATLVARETNTIELDFYELATISGTGKRYLPVLRFAPGSKYPISGVFARGVPQPDEVYKLENLTPHAVHVHLEDGEVVTYPAAGKDSWIRRRESVEELKPMRIKEDKQEHTVRLHRIQQGGIHPDPPRIPGVGYIVPRISADRARRPDFFFPYDEVRDEEGAIIGCRGLGCFDAAERTRWYLDWVQPL